VVRLVRPIRPPLPRPFLNVAAAANANAVAWYTATTLSHRSVTSSSAWEGLPSTACRACKRCVCSAIGATPLPITRIAKEEEGEERGEQEGEEEEQEYDGGGDDDDDDGEKGEEEEDYGPEAGGGAWLRRGRPPRRRAGARSHRRVRAPATDGVAGDAPSDMISA
jgi:hypothetical protein